MKQKAEAMSKALVPRSLKHERQAKAITLNMAPYGEHTFYHLAWRRGTGPITGTRKSASC